MKTEPIRLFRITTAYISLQVLLKGQFDFFQQYGYKIITASAKENKTSSKDDPQHINIPMTRSVTPLLDIYCLWKLIVAIQKVKPDIVHTHTPKAGMLGMIAAWICAVPLRMHTVAGLPLMEARGLKKIVLRAAEKITYKCAHFVYPNSQGLYRYMEHEFNMTNHPKLKVIGKGSSNGINIQYFSRTEELERQADMLRKQWRVEPDEIVFSFVGRIVKDKGITELIEAFKKISQTYKCKLLLVGSFEQSLNPISKQVMNFIQSNKQVISVGFQNDIRQYMIASDIFVFPSYREGFPNVVMQAACLKIPCIVSDINGCNELIEHNYSGIIVPSKNTEALAQAMERLMKNIEERKQFADTAMKFVRDNFEQKFFWHQLKNQYEQQLQKIKNV